VDFTIPDLSINFTKSPEYVADPLRWSSKRGGMSSTNFSR
jgi:hypothetical protein